MEDTRLTAVYHGHNLIDAQLVKGLLESEGLAATVPGEGLNDDFGVLTKMSGVTGTTVMVPLAQLERARELVEVWHEARENHNDSGPD